MSKIAYTGTFQQEATMFENFDAEIINYLQRIAENVGLLNASWNDEDSKKVLETFNTTIDEVFNAFSRCHQEVNRYFGDIQNVLNINGRINNIEFPDLKVLSLSSINASSADGSILFDIDQVNNILTDMKTIATSVINECESFRPQCTALQGSSDDIYGAVQSNLQKAAESFKLIEAPLNKMNEIVDSVRQDYAKRASSIAGSAAN